MAPSQNGLLSLVGSGGTGGCPVPLQRTLAAEILERDPLGRLLLIGSVEGAETAPLLRGNFTSGLYRRMGVSGLSAVDQSEYVELALGLRCDPALRAHWNEQLRRESPRLFHDARAVTELESAWWHMLVSPQTIPPLANTVCPFIQ